MAVYKVNRFLLKIEDKIYDLVLQNDINTKCFTQWYNFKIRNKRNNFIARFNIVNLVLIVSYSINLNLFIIWE